MYGGRPDLQNFASPLLSERLDWYCLDDFLMDVPFVLAYNAGHEVTEKPSRRPVCSIYGDCTLGENTPVLIVLSTHCVVY